MGPKKKQKDKKRERAEERQAELHRLRTMTTRRTEIAAEIFPGSPEASRVMETGAKDKDGREGTD